MSGEKDNEMKYLLIGIQTIRGHILEGLSEYRWSVVSMEGPGDSNEESDGSSDIEQNGDSMVATPKRGGGSTIKIAALMIVLILVVATIYIIFINPSTAVISSVHDGDGDGISDDIDEFPNNPEEWTDSDGDGVGDNGDAFPTDPNEYLDSDEDGIGDGSDEFPFDSTQWADRDNDGHGDNPLGNDPDAFPDDPGEWRDSDSDGVGDNADFYDSGNGRIRISITFFRGDETADMLSSCDPYFIVMVDSDMDGTYDIEDTSEIYQDSETLYNPFFLVVDVPDGQQNFKFLIKVYDSDWDGDDPIDYTTSSSSYWYSHICSSPFDHSWSYDGDEDNVNDEIDCEITYSTSVV
jgi:hypothetical protein